MRSRIAWHARVAVAAVLSLTAGFAVAVVPARTPTLRTAVLAQTTAPAPLATPAAATVPAYPDGSTAAGPGGRDTIVVGVRPAGDMAAVRAGIEAMGGTVTTTYAWGAYVVEVPAGADAAGFSLAARIAPGVKYASRNAVLRAAGTANDPHFLDGSQWHLTRIGAPAAWDSGTGTGVIVAVVDTGIDLTHTDLAGVAKSVPGTDVVNGDGDPADDQGHGTAMAGLAGAWRNNGEYGASVAPDIKLMAVKVLGSDATGSEDEVAAGVRWAADNGADIINMSMSTVAAPAPCMLSDSVEYAQSLGCLVVGASGNLGADGLHATTYPAAYVGVIGVGASTMATPDTVWSSSMHGLRPTGGYVVSLVAPGVGVYSLYPGLSEVVVTGTSASTAIVSGAAAAVWSRYPAMTADEIALRLTSTALDIGTAGVDRESGAGRLRLDSAIEYTPNAPGAPAVQAADPGPEAVVSWTDLSSNETAFQVERARDSTAPAAFSRITTTLADATSYHDTSGLDWTSTWYYRVRAYNPGAVSAYTDVVGIKLDTTPPTTTLLADGSGTIAAWYDHLPTISLQATDTKSGVHETYVDRGSGYGTYTGSFTVASEGANPIGYRSIDHAGNSEGVKATTINVDMTPPTVSSDATTTHYVNSAVITLDGADPGGSGVARRVWKEGAGGVETSAAVATLGIGTHDFYCAAYDAAGNSSAWYGPVVVTVDPVNRAPVAAYDLETAARDTTLTVVATGVLANDADPDGDSLSASLTVAPAHGSLQFRTDGSFDYRGAPGFSGEDAFRYVAFDGSLYSAPATVTIRVSAPVHRFYNYRTGVHFYTISDAEKANVLARRDWPFTYEGVAYAAFAAPVPGTAPVHRFYNHRTNVHFYTASEAERANVVAHTDWPFTYEGIAFHVMPGPASDAGPVYRFYNAKAGAHFYTSSEAERDAVQTKWWRIYAFEGAVFYVPR